MLFGLDMGVFQFDDTLTSVFVDGVIPAVVAAFVCIVFYNQMKTAEVASDAQVYRSFEGLNLTGESEHFVREYAAASRRTTISQTQQLAKPKVSSRTYVAAAFGHRDI